MCVCLWYLYWRLLFVPLRSGSGRQDYRGWAQTGRADDGRERARTPAVPVPRVVSGRPDAVRRLQWQPDPRLAGLHGCQVERSATTSFESGSSRWLPSKQWQITQLITNRKPWTFIKLWSHCSPKRINFLEWEQYVVFLLLVFSIIILWLTVNMNKIQNEFFLVEIFRY